MGHRPRELRRCPVCNHLGRTDLDTVSLTYRLNKWVTFVHEASYIATITANNHEAGGVIIPETCISGPP